MPPLPRLKYYREKRSFSQQELADRAGVSRGTIIDLEVHGRSAWPRTVRKLATALKVKTDDLR